MPCRLLLVAVATLSAHALLTACHSSPEAGQPHATAISPSATHSPTPTPARHSTPSWTPAEQPAIGAAKARYTSALVAIDAALNNPMRASDEKLLQAGTGGAWLIRVVTDVQFFLERGWYQRGKTSVVSLSVASVNLKTEQPEVRLNACLDTSKIGLYYQKTHKPVPAIPANGNRHRIQARVVYAPPVGESIKRWFLIDQKTLGSC